MKKSTRIRKIMGGILAGSVLMMMSACGMGSEINRDANSDVSSDINAQQDDNQATSEAENDDNNNTPIKNSYTEEEKALIESQDGVTISDDGVIQIDISDMFE